MSFDPPIPRPNTPPTDATPFDPTTDDTAWRAHFAKRPSVEAGIDFDLYVPAYRFGWESRARDKAGRRTFEAAESELQSEWAKLRESSVLPWDKARYAVRDAWDRMAIDRSENEGMGTAATHTPEADGTTGT